MYLIDNWTVAKIIEDPNPANTYKNYAFLMPGFNAVYFPFIVVCGKRNISVLNIITLEHKPLISGSMPTGSPGLRFCFTQGDSS